MFNNNRTAVVWVNFQPQNAEVLAVGCSFRAPLCFQPGGSILNPNPAVGVDRIDSIIFNYEVMNIFSKGFIAYQTRTYMCALCSSIFVITVYNFYKVKISSKY